MPFRFLLQSSEPYRFLPFARCNLARVCGLTILDVSVVMLVVKTRKASSRQKP